MNKKTPLLSLAKHLQRGIKAEDYAAKFLKNQGLSIIARNVRTSRGEIDLIAKDGETLVFVEVRARQQNALVSAAASINSSKQNKWRNACSEYLAKNYSTPPDCRCDAILISLEKENCRNIEWIKGLFL